MLQRFTFALLLTCSCVLFAYAEDTLPPQPYPIAGYAADGNLYLYYLEDEPILIAEDDAMYRIYDGYATPVWSHDGQMLAYQGQRSQAGLFTVSLDDLILQPLQADEYLGMNALDFRLDNQALLYTNYDEWVGAENPPGIDHSTWSKANVVVEQAFIESDVSPQIISDSAMATVHGIDGSGGAPTCDSVLFEWAEADLIYLKPQFMADTPQGVVSYYSWLTMYHDDSRLHIGSTSIELPYLSSLSLSAEKDAIAFAVKNENQIGILNLVDQHITTFDIPHQAQSITWNGGRYIYYAVKIEGDEPLISDDDWSLPAFEYMFYCPAMINQVAIYQYDIETGTDSLVYEDAQYSIPRMSLSPDGEQLYFSVIPNGEAWRDNLRDGNCEDGICWHELLPDVYRLYTPTMQIDLLIEDVLKSAINFGYRETP